MPTAEREQEQEATKPLVEKFDKFKIEDGKLLGYAHGMPFEVVEIAKRSPDGSTYVKYYQDGELVEMKQYQAGQWMNNRVYGQLID